MTRKLLTAVTFATWAFYTVSAQQFTFGTNLSPDGKTISVDSKGFLLNGHYVLPVMGEMHYARVPQKDWRREIRKMKAGGITILSTYVFWVHHEPTEGVWNWSGNRNLHSFLQVCKEEGMLTVLRIGPYCHGEAFQGGFPVWLTDKAQTAPGEYALRTTAPGFMAATQRLYSNIFAQANDMLWKQGGPVIGIQIENECRGPWNYYQTLKDMAVSVGFDVPFYTRTGWPKLNGEEVFGQMLPLYGDYSDGFWDRELTDMPGDYPKSFTMKDTRLSSVIATEALGGNQSTEMEKSDLSYPYLTCELGGGMMTSYHRRINISGNEAMPLAICKLGSGSNLPGYYMYHGGSNPYYPLHSMGETQRSVETNYNDMPVISYDFQCPLGEMGQPNQNSFHQTRWLHQFLADWGEQLVTMDVDTLSEHYSRRGCFEFYCDYVRILHEEGTAYVRPVEMPWKNHRITADAQPFCHVGDTLYFVPIKGKTPIAYVDKKRYSLKYDKPYSVKNTGITLCVLSEATARRSYKIDGRMVCARHDGGILYKDGDRITEEYWQETADITHRVTLLRKVGEPRTVPMGSQHVAAMPTDHDFDRAEVYSLTLPETSESDVLSIEYQGDCACVYADGVLVEDNFWNGKPMLVRASDLKGKKLELRILPLRKDAPVYLQKRQRDILNASPNETLLKLVSVKLITAKQS